MPLAIDLYCGLGGWTDGLLMEGYDVIGYDIEAHRYGEHRYPGQLVVKDVLTLHGSEIYKADAIVASPPCQKYSYMAMPWKRAKAMAAAIRADTTGQALADLNRLFDACWRIQREACRAAGRYIPLVIENVKGAQPWVGRARWNYGSFYLWGDVPALMPPTLRATKLNGFRFDGSGRSFQTASVEQTGVKAAGMNWSDQTMRGQDFTRLAGRHALEGIKAGDAGWRERGPGRQLQDRAIKNNGGSWFAIGSPGQKETGQNPDGRKNGKDWFGPGENCSLQRRHGSKSMGRKAASAMIAKIPLPLARHIAVTFRP